MAIDSRRKVTGIGAVYDVSPPELWGAKAYSVDPGTCNAGLLSLTSNRLWLGKFWNQQLCTVSTMSTFVGGLGVSLANYCGYGIYSDGATLSLMSSTPSDTALLATGGWRPKALSAPVTLQSWTPYWVAIVAGGLTMPTIMYQAANASMMNTAPGGPVFGTVLNQTALPATVTRSSLGSAATGRPCFLLY